MPITIEEASNGALPQLLTPGTIRVSRTYALHLNGVELQGFQRLADRAREDLGAYLRAVLFECLATFQPPAPELQQAIDHEADERQLTGRLPL